MMQALPKKVLLVGAPEDRACFQRFNSHHGFEVHESGSLEEAMPLLSQLTFDLLVLDLATTTDPYFEPCRALAKQVPMLFHGHQLAEWHVKKNRYDRAAFLLKPFSLLDFHLAIQEVMRH